MSRNQIEFANVLCHFGAEKVLLDYLDEIILPAFTDDTLIRQRGKETPTNYHFYEVEVEVLDKNSSPPMIGISGQFVKDVRLTRTQIFDTSKGLVEDKQSMASSPSSYFLFLLNSHQLIYLPKTPHAPSVGEFASTVSSFIKRKHVAFIDALYDAAKSGEERVTKRSLWEQHPAPTIDIVPLATTESVASFIRRFSLLKVIQFKLLKPNPTVNAEDAFKGMQGILSELHAKSGQVVTKSDTGMDKAAAIRVVGQAAAAGTNEIKLQGNAPDGATLSGSNDDFKIRVPVETMPTTQKGVVRRMLEAFTSTVSHLVPHETAGDGSRARKLTELAKNSMSGAAEIMQELFAEKSLLHVYRNSGSYSENRFDRCIRITTLVILCAASLTLILSRPDLFPIAVKSITSWLSLGFTYATTILGFLVAGFTIFSTMTRTEVFIALARKKHDTLGVSQLKFIFFSFLRVFILHIVLIFACVIVTMLKDSSGIYLSVLHDDQMSITIKQIAVLVILPVIGYLIISTLLHLKTFVWNLYQSIIIAVAGAAVMHELERAAAKSQGDS